MSLLTFLLGRLGSAAVRVLAVLVLNFLLIRLAPGDPIETLAGQMGGITEEIRADLRKAYGLDKPLPAQLAIYLTRVAAGDLGYSYFFNLPVTQLILERLPATLLLVLTSLLIALVAGTVLACLPHGGPTVCSQMITVVSVIGYSAPVFWTGMLLVILFASLIPILPVSGMRSAAIHQGGLTDSLDVARHLILPGLSLAIVYLAQYARLTRASMLDVLGADYIRTARAKGLTENTVYFHHALRNALLRHHDRRPSVRQHAGGGDRRSGLPTGRASVV